MERSPPWEVSRSDSREVNDHLWNTKGNHRIRKRPSLFPFLNRSTAIQIISNSFTVIIPFCVRREIDQLSLKRKNKQVTRYEVRIYNAHCQNVQFDSMILQNY
jgi:hypothetical protein